MGLSLRLHAEAPRAQSSMSEEVSSLHESLRKLREEKEKAMSAWEAEKTQLEASIHSHEKEQEETIASLQAELRSRVSVETMKQLQRDLSVLQQVGVPVRCSEESEVPLPDTERVLLEKLQRLETSNSDLRVTFNSIYNKYMTSENERHALEERLEDATAMVKKLEQQVSDLERRTPGAQKGSVESILREQRDRYKRRVEELEVGAWSVLDVERVCERERNGGVAAGGSAVDEAVGKRSGDEA